MGKNSLCCELFELLWWEILLSEKCIEKPNIHFMENLLYYVILMSYK